MKRFKKRYGRGHKRNYKKSRRKHYSQGASVFGRGGFYIT